MVVPRRRNPYGDEGVTNSHNRASSLPSFNLPAGLNLGVEGLSQVLEKMPLNQRLEIEALWRKSLEFANEASMKLIIGLLAREGQA
jgi:hypothetical protein